MKGSFKRVGDGDYPMSEYEICSFETFRKNYHDEVRTLNCGMETLNPSNLANYLLRLKASKPHLANLDDEQICNLMGTTEQDKVTLASELILGLYPQAYAPQLCITAVRIYGKQKGELGPKGNRFEDNQRTEGTIPEMLEGCLSFLKRNLSSSTKIDPTTGARVDTEELPMVALREVILNALIHRDYSAYTEGTPIQVELFSDRLEVRNPGGLYGRISINELGYVQGTTRNPVLATAAETLGITENRYSGIPTIRKCMEAAGKPQPEFIDKGAEFLAILRIGTQAIAESKNGTKELGSKTINERTQQVVVYCSTPRSRREIALYLGVGEEYAMRRYINPLLNSGKLMRTVPDKPRNKNQKYVVAE